SKGIRIMRTVGLAGVFLLSLAALGGMLPTPKTAAPLKALRFGKVIQSPEKVITNAVVIIENDRIRSVTTDDSAIPGDAAVIDLTRYTDISGLIDAHTHMTYYWDQAPSTQPRSQSGTRALSTIPFLAQENARKSLETGVTTVRDLGASEYLDIAMRELINQG